VKRLLVALDASERASKVLEAAVRLAELTGSKLILYRAIAVPPELPREVLVATDVPLEDILVRNAHGDLQRLAERVPAQLIEQITTALGTPWDGICRAAREHDVDLIVIGSHGYGGIDRILGTTAAKVVNHADRNVLVVRTLL
jgi:nucleotide-binding universal stress UspA family protein